MPGEQGRRGDSGMDGMFGADDKFEFLNST